MSEESLETIPDKFVRTKTTLAIMTAVVVSFTYMAAVLGFDLKATNQAKEQLEIAKMNFEEKKLDIELKKIEFEMYKSGAKTCILDHSTQEKINHSFELAHKKNN